MSKPITEPSESGEPEPRPAPPAPTSSPPAVINTISTTATITGTVIQAGNIYAPGGLRL